MSRNNLNTHIQTLIKHLPFFASTISILLACLTLIGWIFDISILASLIPSGHRMSPTSMISFLFAGASLALMHSPPVNREIQGLARGFALVVLFFGLFATIDILLGLTPSLEQHLFAWVFSYAHPQSIKAASAQGALSFVFLGAALLFLDVPSLRARMQVYLSACVTLLISTLSLLGYGFQARSLYEMTPARGIALNTTCALILLSLGVLSSRVDMGLMKILTGHNVSGQVARRLLVAAIIVPLLLALVAIVGERVGRYDSAFGAALLIVLNITIFLALIWRSAELLHKVEAERQQAQTALHQAYQNLEERVEQRTAELAIANEGLRREIVERQKVEEERARLLASEQRAREQAEKDSRLKDEFLNTVSHELRAPLNTIRGWVAMLRAGTLDEEEQSRALDRVERGGREMEQKVNDLLDVSRLVNGRLQLQIRPVDLGSVIDAAVEAARPAANAKNIVLQSQFHTSSAGALELVWGDANRLQQAIWNLLSNAIKFTPQGGRVTVRLQVGDGDLEIVVRDTGVGISSDVLPFIFDHFRQADGSRTRGQRGLGVGLTIVRYLVEMHGGTVRIESGGDGRGTTSIIRLPMVKNSMQGTGRVGAKAAFELPAELSCPANIGGLRVLVVDEDSHSRRLIYDTLVACKASVRAAESVDDALLLLAGWQPDVVIFDMELHRGEETFATRLRALAVERGAKIPVVALTSQARVEDRLQALQAGFTMPISRPVEPAELLAVLSSVTARIAGKLYFG